MVCWIYLFIGLPSHPYFVPPIQVSYLGCDYYIWNRLEALKTMLLPLAKNGRYTNWFGSFHFHNYLKWDDFCHHEWKFKIQRVEWNVFSAEIRIHFISNRKEIVYVHTYYYQTTSPLSVRTIDLVREVFFPIF